MKKRYHILDSAKQQPVSPNDLTRLLSQNSQLMLPWLNWSSSAAEPSTRYRRHRPRRHSSRAGTVGAASYRWKTFPARQEAPRRCGPLGPPARSRQAQQPQTARQQTQTAQTLRRRGQSARLRSDAGRRTPRRAHARHSDEGRLDAQLCRGVLAQWPARPGCRNPPSAGRQSRPPKRASTKCSRGAWMSWICW